MESCAPGLSWSIHRGRCVAGSLHDFGCRQWLFLSHVATRSKKNKGGGSRRRHLVCAIRAPCGRPSRSGEEGLVFALGRGVLGQRSWALGSPALWWWWWWWGASWLQPFPCGNLVTLEVEAIPLYFLVIRVLLAVAPALGYQLLLALLAVSQILPVCTCLTLRRGPGEAFCPCPSSAPPCSLLTCSATSRCLACSVAVRSVPGYGAVQGGCFYK